MSTLLDTRVVTPSDRSDYWSAGVAEHFFPMRVESVGRRAFEARLTGTTVGAVGVRTISGVPHSVRRTSQMIAQGDPDSLLLYLMRTGSCRIEQDDRACVLGPGDLAVQDTSRPSAFELVDPATLIVFSFPKWLLGARVGSITRHSTVRLTRGGQSLAMLGAPFLAGLARSVEDATVSESEAEGLAETLAGMLWTLFGGGEGLAGPETRSDLLRARMRRFAQERLGDPELGPEQIAAAHFVSTRYVHKLFAATGSGVSAWIREQRMERARDDLRQSGDASIGSIASRWGYCDPASFSRAFRQTYGCSPRDMRRQA